MRDSKAVPAQNGWIDLCRPFATVVAISLAVLIAKFAFGLEIKNIDFSFGGNTATLSKVDEKAFDAGNALVNLNDRFTVLQNELDQLTSKINNSAPPVRPSLDTTGAAGISGSPASDGIGTNDTLAALFKPVTGTASPLANKDGYIFIGNRRGDTLLLDSSGLITGSGSVQSIEQLQTEQTYSTGANLVLRAGQPDIATGYFNGQKSLGVLPKNTRVTLLDTPKPVKLQDGRIQMWAHVRVDM